MVIYLRQATILTSEDIVLPVNDDFINDNSIKAHAEVLVKAGISVIPLATNSKRPALGWKSFQSRVPTQHELDDWFDVRGFTGLGIVTGTISRLAVIDFDDPALYQHFCQQFQFLGITYTVKTAKGYHLYYRLPQRVLLKTRRVPGIDLQVDGRYVVAPPTQINDHTYHPIKLAPPILLSHDDQREIMAYLDSYHTVPIPAEVIRADTCTRDDLIRLYRALANRGGRNNALFLSGCFARDRGWSRQATSPVLVPQHIQLRTVDATQKARRSEAVKTLASVYTRPA